MREAAKELPDAPPLASVSTPSYRGTHISGFQDAVRSLFDRFAEGGPRGRRTILLPGFVSPADLRSLKETAATTNFEAEIVPDYSDTLDGGSWDAYRSIPTGGTPLSSLRAAGRALAVLELGGTLALSQSTPGALLQERFGVERVSLGLPIGLAATDAYFAVVERLSGRRVHESILAERARLVDAYVDGHKYLYGLKVVVFGDPDLTAALAGFLFEIGAKPVVCATGSEGVSFEKAIRTASPEMKDTPLFLEGADYQTIEEAAKPLGCELLLGPSKGFTLERALGVPLVRVGFPVHDRFGSGRLRHLGYGGSMELFDRLVNTVLEGRQNLAPIGNSYQ
jgi:nitrogenase molybdenum-iron protein NifN